MDPDKLERLRKNHIILKQDLDTTKVLDHLLTERVFQFEDCDTVRSKSTQEERNQELLSKLRRTGNKGYDTFLSILKQLESHLAEKLEQTPLDQEVQGEQLTENIFYNPSEDFELKRLIDQLTKDDKITQEQLERMKLYVIGEVGCSESIIRTKDNPRSFLRHLMDVRLVTRYNLTFLQALFWNVDLKDHCEQIAVFARNNEKKPVFFFTPGTTDNGYVACELHVQGNLANFTGVNVDEICYRISKYLGLPRTCVRPVGVKPSNSVILTILIPEHSSAFLEAMEDFSWLVDFGVDSITIKTKSIKVYDADGSSTELDDEKSALEREISKKLETEKLLKQCLYDEQMANETLREMYDEKEKESQGNKEDFDQQSRINSGLFCAVMTTLHLISQLLRYNLSKQAREPYDNQERNVRTHFKDVIKRARGVCSSEVLQEVIDAHVLVKDVTYARELEWFVQSFRGAVGRLQAFCQDAVMNKTVGRMLGSQATQLPPQPQTEVKVKVEAMYTVVLTPDLDGIVVDLAEKLTAKHVHKLVTHYKLPEELRSETNKHNVFRLLLIEEVNRTGALSEETIDRIMEEAISKVSGRKDLWEEFKSRNKKRRQAHTKNLSDVPQRLDNIEKLLKHMVAQNLATPFSSGIPFPSHGYKIPAFSKEKPCY